MLTIRQEKPEDYRQVEQVVEQAFAHAEHTDHDEHNLVARLRGSEAFIPELSLVAEQDGRIVGHILFTKLKVGQTTQLALAPLAVHPDFQRQGIGGALIEEGTALRRSWDMTTPSCWATRPITRALATSWPAGLASSRRLMCRMKITWRSTCPDATRI